MAMSRSALDKRVWPFQETTLSTRILYFKEAELMWECKDAFECECRESALESAEGREYLNKCMDEIGFGSPLLFTLLDMGNDKELPESCTLSFWSNVVFEYCDRWLTYQTDILPALSGAAKKFQRPSLGAYLAGMWEHQLPQSLWWRVSGHHEFSDETFLELRENRVRRKYLAPSWSWASGPYSLDSGDWAKILSSPGAAFSTADAPYLAKIRWGEYRVVTSLWRKSGLSFHEDPFRLELHVDDLVYYWQAAPLRSLESQRTQRNEQSANWNMVELYLQLEDFALLQSLGEAATYALLRIGGLHTRNESREHFYAILLKSSENHPGAYERLGIVDGERTYSATNSFYLRRVYEIMTEHFENASDATVVIV